MLQVVPQSVNVNLAPTTNLGAFKGGSLPNVSEQNRKQQINKTGIDASKKVFQRLLKENIYCSSFICLVRLQF